MKSKKTVQATKKNAFNRQSRIVDESSKVNSIYAAVECNYTNNYYGDQMCKAIDANSND